MMKFETLTCLLSAIATAAAAGELPEPPSYVVCRTPAPIEIDGRLDDPAWFTAESISQFHFPWHTSGEREQSVVKLLWDDENLYIATLCQDAHITARHTEHDGPIPEDDCIEIMVAPDPAKPKFYFNVEWNVLGGYVDGHRPNGAEGPRAPWDAEGVQIAGTHVGTLNDDRDQDQWWLAEVAIPLRNFTPHMKNRTVQPGSEWRANFNRHGGETNMQYSQWSPADTPAPAFHVPHRFGRLVFSDKSLPFGSGQAAGE